jgi:hypothetical protein
LYKGWDGAPNATWACGLAYQRHRRLPMTVTAENLLAAFDALSPHEQQQVGAEILRRTAGTGDLPEAAFDELAAELFRAYEAEEAGRAGA